MPCYQSSYEEYFDLDRAFGDAPKVLPDSESSAGQRTSVEWAVFIGKEDTGGRLGYAAPCAQQNNMNEFLTAPGMIQPTRWVADQKRSTSTHSEPLC